MHLPDAPFAAEKLLADAEQTKAPVDLRRVCALWPALQVRAEHLDRDGYLVNLGRIGAEIVLRRSDSMARRRFTLAHELGHLHLADEGCSDAPEHLLQASRAEVERWCDRFAASLLMPERWLLRDLATVRIGSLLPWMLTAPKQYKVSHHAFRLRVSELTAISVFEAARNGDSVHAAHRYDSNRVTPERITEAIDAWAHSATINRTSSPMYWRDVRLISIHKQFGRANTGWLVCLIPSIEEQRSLTPAAPLTTALMRGLVGTGIDRT